MHPEAKEPSAFRPADPFRAEREASGVSVRDFHGERMLMILGWKDVRQAARNIANFDSGELGRVPIPPETGIRSFRQIPIETNPPEHTAWKDLLQVYFRRPMQDRPKASIRALVKDAVTRAAERDSIELISEFALPLQSAALTVLLDCDPALADEWVSWGLHAFRTDGKTDPAKANRFLDFIDRMLTRGATSPDEGFFSYLHAARIDGRLLTEDEKRGACHLALAGGRDTLINSVVGTLAYLAEHPDDFARLRREPNLIDSTVEELFRVLSPLPQIGRVCPHGFSNGEATVAPGARAALCWASANRDDRVFDDAEAVKLDRAPNPHVAFGAGAHTCLGAPMARLLLRSLLADLVHRDVGIRVLSAEPRQNDFGTPYLFHVLHAKIATGDAGATNDTPQRRQGPRSADERDTCQDNGVPG